jgi:hypothetical protein
MSRPSDPPVSREPTERSPSQDRRAPGVATRHIDCTARTGEESAVRPPRGRAASESRATVLTRPRGA